MNKNDLSRYQILSSWSEEDGCYLAEMPELPGCMADGRTEEEARKNILVIAQEWIDTARLLGRSIPEPKLTVTPESLISA